MTAFVLLTVFCFGHELGRVFLSQHYPLPQAAVGQCFDNRSENANFTFAPIDLHPHGYVTVPGYWSKTDVACPDGMTEFVVDHSVLICVSNKLLTKLKKKEDKRAEKHLLMNMMVINNNYWIQKERGDVVLDD